MTWLDPVIIIVVLWFAFAAFHAGFVRETVTILGAVLGVIAAGLLYDSLADDVLPFIDNETLARIVAFGAIFTSIALAAQLVAALLKPAIMVLQLGIFDSVGGALFGVAKGLLVVAIFLVVFVTFPRWTLDKTIGDSLIAPKMLEYSDPITALLPDEFEAHVTDFNKNN